MPKRNYCKYKKLMVERYKSTDRGKDLFHFENTLNQIFFHKGKTKINISIIKVTLIYGREAWKT